MAINTSDTTLWDQTASYDIEVHHNIIHHGCDGASACSYVTLGPVNIYRNVIYRMGGIVKDGTSTAGGRSGTCRLYQNTAAVMLYTINDPYDWPSQKNTILRNNVMHYTGYNGWVHYWTYSNNPKANGWSYFPFSQGPDSDYNMFWQTRYPANTTQIFGSFTYSDASDGRMYTPAQFATMTADTGLDTHGFQNDPLFVNRAELYPASRATFDANGEVEALSLADFRDLIAEGYDVAFAREFTRTWNYFALETTSPAVGAGEQIPTSWPETAPRVASPTLGAGPAPSFLDTEDGADPDGGGSPDGADSADGADGAESAGDAYQGSDGHGVGDASDAGVLPGDASDGMGTGDGSDNSAGADGVAPGDAASADPLVPTGDASVAGDSAQATPSTMVGGCSCASRGPPSAFQAISLAFLVLLLQANRRRR